MSSISFGPPIYQPKAVTIHALRTRLAAKPDRLSPILISLVRNESLILPEFFRHYRLAGIERFVIVDNDSSDGTLKLLQQQQDVDVFTCSEDYSVALQVSVVRHICDLYGNDRWYVCADADEHIVFNGSEQHSIPDLARHMDSRGIRRVRGLLVDMYCDGPIRDVQYDPESRLVDCFPFFDVGTYVEAANAEFVSVKGGPRNRLFKAIDQTHSPELTKYPLFHSYEGEVHNPHFGHPYYDNFDCDRVLAILHFKLPGISEKIADAILRGCHWNDSFEYKCYRDALESQPKLAFMGPMSRRYSEPRDLVRTGVIAAVPWSATPEQRDNEKRARGAALVGRMKQLEAALVMRDLELAGCAAAVQQASERIRQLEQISGPRRTA